MKKSELKKYIRENVISELSENTEDEIAKTKELTTAIKDLESAKKEAGIEEGEDNWADYTDIGQFYLEGFGKEHTLDDNQLEELGKKIVKQLYKGDIGKAYDAIVRPQMDGAAKRLADRGQLKNPRYTDGTSIKEANVGLAEIEEMGYNAADEVFTIIRKSYLNSQIDFRYFQKGLMRGLSDIASSMGLNENEDAEPTKSDIKKTKGLAKAKEELALLTREMKSLAKKYSKAEGADKEKLVKILKDKTKLKKELENILDKKKI
tara:strand:- start:5014 stop:5802 length:789 start_codon:yes stop_codon:yes gene_type:complete